ncbi:MAG: RHS repeat protein [Gammaproteobacteria bacterium]|nr:RHS repeat protein [Gammaproteobacteria bacterium]
MHELRNKLWAIITAHVSIWLLLFNIFTPAYAASPIVLSSKTLEYDLNGNLDKIITANNETVILEYDALNRLEKRINPDGE